MLSSKRIINNRLVVRRKDKNKDTGSMMSSINCISFHFKWKTEHSTSLGNQRIPTWVENKLSTLCGQKFLFPPNVGTLFCFTKFTKYIYIKSILTNLSLLLNTITSQMHQSNIIKNNLMHDIETNPGPCETLKIFTINCRGLGEIEEFSLLLNRAYGIMQKGKMNMMIQETMITNSR